MALKILNQQKKTGPEKFKFDIIEMKSEGVEWMDVIGEDTQLTGCM